jgi:ketosteroid isomerase-like protein
MDTSRRRIAAAVVVLGGATLGLAAVTRDAAAQAGDDAEVAGAVEAFRTAMLTNDRAQFEVLCAAQMSYGHSSGKIQTKAEFIADATSGKTTWKSLEFSDVKNSAVGTNAISRFTLTGEIESEGKLTPVKIGVLMVWQKEATGWKLLARQAFRI